MRRVRGSHDALRTQATVRNRQSGSAQPDARDWLPLESVHRGRLYEQVLRQFQQLIASGQLKPGDKLPPERELGRRFQVSRSSVQDAIHALQLMGLVRSKQGGRRSANRPPNHW